MNLLGISNQRGKLVSYFLNNAPKTGLVDSLETPEVTEITENFTKVTKYLIKLKDTLINYV